MKATLPSFSKKSFWIFYGCYVAMLVVGAFFSEGWIQPDEHARVLEPAHYLAYGYATLPWEFDAKFPIVSFFLGTIHAWILMITKLVGCSAMVEAALLRAFTAVVCSTRLIAFYWLLPLCGLIENYFGWYLLIFAFNAFAPVLLVHTAQQNWSATAIIWAIFLLFSLVNKTIVQTARQKSATIIANPLLKWRVLVDKRHLATHKDHPLTRPIAFDALLLGICMALAVSFRPQTGPSMAALGGLALWILGFRRAIVVVIGVIMGLIPMAVVDWWHHGIPFMPMWNYLVYALGNEDGGQVWGTDPWYFYFYDCFLVWFPPLSPILLPPLALGFLRQPILFIIFLPFVAVHCILGHKDSRYFTAMFPVMILASCVGFEWIINRWPTWFKKIADSTAWRRFFKGFFVFNAVLGVAALALPLNTSPRMFTKLGELVDEHAVSNDILYVGNTRSSVSQFYTRHPGLKLPQMALNEFMDDFHNNKLNLPRTLVLYCISTPELKEIENRCHEVYLSVPQWYKRLISLNPDVKTGPKVHAILECPR